MSNNDPITGNIANAAAEHHAAAAAAAQAAASGQGNPPEEWVPRHVALGWEEEMSCPNCLHPMVTSDRRAVPVVDLQQWARADHDELETVRGMESMERYAVLLPWGLDCCSLCLSHNAHDSYDPDEGPTDSIQDDARMEMIWSVHNTGAAHEQCHGQVPDNQSFDHPAWVHDTRRPRLCLYPGCNFGYSMGLCLKNCPGLMIGVKFPDNFERMARLPPTYYEGCNVIRSVHNIRHPRVPPANQPNPVPVYIPDICHRCLLIRVVSFLLRKMNDRVSPAERVHACLITDPEARNPYQTARTENHADLHGPSVRHTASLFRFMARQPWGVPVSGTITRNARIVLRPSHSACVCTRAPGSTETSCRAWARWAHGALVTDTWHLARREYWQMDNPPRWWRLREAARERGEDVPSESPVEDDDETPVRRMRREVGIPDWPDADDAESDLEEDDVWLFGTVLQRIIDEELHNLQYPRPEVR